MGVDACLKHLLYHFMSGELAEQIPDKEKKDETNMTLLLLRTPDDKTRDQRRRPMKFDTLSSSYSREPF